MYAYAVADNEVSISLCRKAVTGSKNEERKVVVMDMYRFYRILFEAMV